MDVLEPGTRVIVGDEIPAIVTAVLIKGDGYSYEVVWWQDRVRYQQWMHPAEVRAGGDTAPLRIGFGEV